MDYEKNNDLDIGNMYDSSDSDNSLGMFSEPKSKVASKSMEQNLLTFRDSIHEEDMSFPPITVGSEIELAAANISDFKIISSTKTYTRKKESVRLSENENKTKGQGEKNIEQNHTIQKSKFSQDVSDSDIPNMLPHSSIVRNHKNIYESNEDTSTLLPRKKLKGAYARTRKNLVQKIKSKNYSNLNKSRHRSVKHSSKIKKSIKPQLDSQSDLTRYSQDISETFSLDSLISSPIQPSNFNSQVNDINNQNCIHDQKTSNYKMSLMDMLNKYSSKRNDNMINDIPVSKNQGQKCALEISQNKKISEEKAVISPQSLVNSDLFLEAEHTNQKISTELDKDSKKNHRSSDIKSKKQLKKKICSGSPYNKNVKTLRKKSARSVQINSSCLDKNVTNRSILNSSQNRKLISTSIVNTSVTNTNCFENTIVENQNNFANLASNQGMRFIATSTGNIPVGNHMPEVLPPVVINPGNVFNAIPQINPPVFQSNALLPASVTNPTSIYIFAVPCCKCSSTPSTSQIVSLFNKTALPSAPAPVIQLVNNDTTFDCIKKQVDDISKQPTQQNILNQNAQQNNSVNLNNEQNIDHIDLYKSVNLTNVSNNLPQFSLKTTIINNLQTDKQTGLNSECDSSVSEDEHEEDTSGSTNEDLMAAFIAFNGDLIKDIHKSSIEELRNNILNHNCNYIKFKTVSSYYSSPQVQEVLDSFCSPYLKKFPIEYKLPYNFKNINICSLLKDYVKFHVLHILNAHPQMPFNKSRFSVLKKGNSQLNIVEKELFRSQCSKHQELDLKYLISILGYVGLIILYTEYVKVISL